MYFVHKKLLLVIKASFLILGNSVCALDIDHELIQSSQAGNNFEYYGSLADCSCGLSKKNKRIVGGKETVPYEYPFILSVILTENNKHFCGATVLTKEHAITAAHCTRNAGKKSISVIAGAHNIRHIDKTTQKILVVKYVEHENYVHGNLPGANDIAILRLAKPLQFNSLVSPICLPTQPQNLIKKPIKFIGWGKTSADGHGSPVLKEIDVTINTYEECKSYFGQKFTINTNNPIMFCASGPERTACMGDSGGPAIYLDSHTNRYSILGIVSFGGGKCNGKKPTVLTDVSAYFNWIKNTVSSLQ